MRFESNTPSKGDFRAGLWRLADPKISLASMASIFLGACAAAYSGPIHFGWLALVVVGIFAIEVAKNASGEVFDFDSGVDQAVADRDRSPFSGGKRVLVDGLLTRAQTWAISTIAYAVGVGCGLVIVAFREPSILAIGIIGVAFAYFYHAPPVQLSYRGQGELAVMMVYGPMIAAGTFLTLEGALPLPVILLSIPLGLLTGAFLWINEFPDYESDRSAGKNTWIVMLGKRRASRVFACLLMAAFALTLSFPEAGLPRGAWLGWVGIIPAWMAARTLWRYYDHTERIIPAQAQTLLAFLLYSAGTGIGLLASR